MVNVRRERLPKAQFDEIFSLVPRLTVELVITSSDGVLLSLRASGPCAGLWHLPGGTVRYGEPLTDAVARVAHDELGCDVTLHELLGYLEYPSHLEQGIDWPVGIAFRCQLDPTGSPIAPELASTVAFYDQLPAEMHEEQRSFLVDRGVAR